MVKGARIVFAISSWVFVAGVVLQVFLAGMAVVAETMSWAPHASLGHLWGLPVVLMLITAYVGRLPRSLKWLAWALFGVFVLQAEVVIFLRQTVPVLSAFHPVLALVDFALGVKLGLAAWSLVKQPITATGTPAVLEGAQGQ